MCWESVTEDRVVLVVKSKATRMRSPALVLAGKETANELALLEAALAVACTNEMAVGAALMVRVRVALPVPVLFVALRLTVEVPAAVGVPEINPLVLLTDSPLGNPVAA